VLRMEYEKARTGVSSSQGGYQGYQTAAAGQDPYAGYYAVRVFLRDVPRRTLIPYLENPHSPSLLSSRLTLCRELIQQAQAGATPDGQAATPQAGGATPAQGTDAYQQYAAYWAAYGYDVNDPQFQAWQASQYGQGQAGVAGGQTPAAA
jgi:hypothetical protein